MHPSNTVVANNHASIPQHNYFDAIGFSEFFLCFDRINRLEPGQFKRSKSHFFSHRTEVIFGGTARLKAQPDVARRCQRSTTSIMSSVEALFPPAVFAA